MPENEFEKKVSSELQGLKFRPSETVWMKVEERIRKKRNKRVFLIIFLLAGLSLVGYWQWDNFFGDRKNEVAQTETSTFEKNNNTDQNDEDIKKENGLSKEKQTGDAAVKSKDENEKKETVTTTTTNKPGKGIPPNTSAENATVNKRTTLPVGKKRIDPKNKKRFLMPAQKREAVLKDNDLTIIVPDKPATKDDVRKPAEVNNADQDININSKPTENKLDSARLSDIDPHSVADRKPSVNVGSVISKDTLAKKIDSVSRAITADSPIVKFPTSSFDKKWKWGAQFVPGISFLNENGFTFNTNKSADALNYQSPSAGSGGSAPWQKPSEMKPGFAFQLGVVLQKQLNQKTNFSFGLQYGFYSTHIGIGFRRDSLLRFASQLSSLQEATSVYNAGGDTIHYTNRYHFIQFPLRFQWQLNKNKTRPISWDAGASVSYLFVTNALMYDTAFNGIYYQNSKRLNRTQFSLSTGFSFAISNNRRMQWSLGPFVDFHLNKLVDNPFERKKYLVFTGIRTSVVFNK